MLVNNMVKNNYIFNTGETHEDLRNTYNPDGSILRRAQLRMLDMLIYFDSVCKKIGVEYVLEGGNALGAIRHGGFIPWDDDVDVDMKWSDYKMVCKYLIKHPHPQFVLQTPQTDSGFWGNWAVLRDTKSEYIQNSVIHNKRHFRGLQIDIFPMEYNCSPLLHRIAAKLYRWNTLLINHSRCLTTIFYYIRHRLIHPFFRILDKLLVKEKGYYMYCYGHGGKTKFPFDSLFPAKDLMYEGMVFKGPNNIDKYLKTFFHNYMDLPPKEDRNKHQASYLIFD